MSEKLRLVQADDWSVLYLNDDKVYEGHESGGNLLYNLCEKIPYDIETYEFTDEDEIDGCTPDKFSDIIGIKRLYGD
jgi:hypothetical protein